MQKLNKYIIMSGLAAALSFSGCSDGYFDELAQNPNQVTTPTLQALLTTSTSKAGINSYSVANITNPYVQYTASPSASSGTDTYETINYSGTWDALYYAMADANEMKKLALAQGASEYLGVADLLIAYNLTLVNDLWGDAPFSETFSLTNFTPKYDDAKTIYNTCMTLVDEGIAELSKTDATVKLASASDLIYGTGNTTTNTERQRWLKFAYALKARLLNKVSKTTEYNASAVLAAVEQSFTSNADDAGMATFPTRNNWASTAISNANQSLGGWLSEQLIDHLNGKTYGIPDPRISKITDPTPVAVPTAYNPNYIGTVNGAGNRAPGANTTKDENYISVNSPWTSATAPLLIVTYSELKFIEAEAALRAGDKGRAYTAYLAGIRANMDRLQVTAADQDVYVNNAAVSVGSENLTLALIFKEKYVATYLNPEAWNDARRFDYQYKDFTMPVNATLPTYIRRIDFPLSERSENGANVPAETPRTTKLWWDL